MKKWLVAIVVLAAVAGFGYYLMGTSRVAPVEPSGSEGESVEFKGESGAEAGTVFSLGDEEIALLLADGTARTYRISPGVAVFRIADVDIADIDSGAAISVVTDPQTGAVVSVTLPDAESGISVSPTEDWYIVGTVKGVTGRDITLETVEGTERKVTVPQEVSVKSAASIDIGDVAVGEAVKVSWYKGEDGVLRAGGIYPGAR